MGLLIALLAFVGAAVVWAFFSFPPDYADKKILSVFNWSVIGAGAMICLAFVLKMKVMYSAETLAKFRLAFQVAGTLGIGSCWLGLMFVLRNFWIFKPRSPTGRGGWY